MKRAPAQYSEYAVSQSCLRRATSTGVKPRASGSLELQPAFMSNGIMFAERCTHNQFVTHAFSAVYNLHVHDIHDSVAALRVYHVTVEGIVRVLRLKGAAHISACMVQSIRVVVVHCFAVGSQCEALCCCGCVTCCTAGVQECHALR